MNKKEVPYKKGYFACPDCRKYLPNIKVKCDCGLELNATEKIKNLVKQLEKQEKITGETHKRLGEMNLLFSKVVKWNYKKIMVFKNMPYDKLNELIHKWQKDKDE